MSSFLYALYELRRLDELARGKSWVHGLHPLAKCLTALAFIATVASFSRYEVVGLFPFFIYPIFLAAAGDIPLRPIIKRLLMAEPFIVIVGLLNPIFDQGQVAFGPWTIGSGWISLASLILRGSLAVIAGLMLAATTGMEDIVMALGCLGIPRILRTQIWLTYRYLSLLIEETARTVYAYVLRSYGRGVKMAAWGSLAGRILLRTVDRGERIYQAMVLKGGIPGMEGRKQTIRLKDMIFTILWISLFLLLRLVDLPELLGSLLMGS